MKELIQKLTERQNLSQEEARQAMQFIMEGNSTDAQIAAFLIALKMKGEQPWEILGFVEIMREKSVKIRIDDPDAIDMCGTGGDGAGTFNISTVASFVVAGAGVTVAKHGNRSISSSCGSADVLASLGINIQLMPEKVEACINSVGIGFMFAPLFHPAMKYAAKPRSEMGVKTCFNILGPMTNPANVKRQLVGAFNKTTAKKMAEVFSMLNSIRVLVVHSHEGLDEVSLEAPTTVYDIKTNLPNETYRIEPSAFGLPAVKTSAILGGTAEVNAKIALDILEGKNSPHRNIVIANAALGLLSAGKTTRIEDSVSLAAESIDSGKALTKLHRLKEISNS